MLRKKKKFFFKRRKICVSRVNDKQLFRACDDDYTLVRESVAQVSHERKRQKKKHSFYPKGHLAVSLIYTNVYIYVCKYIYIRGAAVLLDKL